ncbi:multidrug efflux SMR transporter [Methanofollis formosanus]|uniref:Multidrug efflux SMR transporter n=1 Tax=Methanofollis formosanus TaxID=299308 RepID=A0A8G1A160_9EURY|nr:multidrug efflux SMR transporter [Methanofollis formosanus]QYZ78773.1 multidrug efflux SMR transporter [Methanofollis formosanus]
MNALFILLGAVGIEVCATTCLKLSDGFTHPLPSLGVVAGYATSFWLLSLVLKELDVGVAYAVWAGLGTALVAVIGLLVFKESFSLFKAASVLLIVLGVVGLNLGGGVH